MFRPGLGANCLMRLVASKYFSSKRLSTRSVISLLRPPAARVSPVLRLTSVSDALRLETPLDAAQGRVGLREVVEWDGVRGAILVDHRVLDDVRRDVVVDPVVEAAELSVHAVRL